MSEAHASLGAPALPVGLQVRGATGPVVGRPIELGAIRQELASARAGRLTALTLEGEPGIGKTRLLAAAAEVAVAEGFTPLAATGDEEIRGPFLLARGIFDLLTKLHEAGICHGDAQLQNFIVCPQPLEVLPIDFEMTVFRDRVDEATWHKRIQEDFVPLFTEAICLQCGLGEQPDALGRASLENITALFHRPERFVSAMERNAGRGGGS